MRALAVTNPNATGMSPRTRDVIIRALGSELKVDVAETARRGHAADLAAQARADGLDLVIAVGGDGTVNEVVGGLLRDGVGEGTPRLAVVPGGSANVFARALGLPAEPIEAAGIVIELLRARRERTIGLGRLAAGAGEGRLAAGAGEGRLAAGAGKSRLAAGAGESRLAAGAGESRLAAGGAERWFTFCAGFGLDAEVVREVERRRATGARATPGLYTRTALRQFMRTDRRHPAVTIEPDGDGVPGGLGPLSLAIITNTTPWTYLGDRPLQPTPEASFDTGLDIFALRRLRAPTTASAAWRLLRGGTPRGRQFASIHDQAGVSVRCARPVAVQVDGEYIGECESAHLDAVPEALAVIC